MMGQLYNVECVNRVTGAVTTLNAKPLTLDEAGAMYRRQTPDSVVTFRIQKTAPVQAAPLIAGLERVVAAFMQGQEKRQVTGEEVHALLSETVRMFVKATPQ